MLYQWIASLRSTAVPRPLSYIAAVLNMAETLPASAARRYQDKAVAKSCGTPWPVS